MPWIGTLGSTLPLRPKNLKVKCQAFPHGGSTGFKQPNPASSPVTGNYHSCQGSNWMWQVALRISFLTQGLTTLSWPPTLEPFPPKPVPFWVLQEKQLQKDSPEHFFVAGMDKYFPTSFWWSLSVLLPYWEEIFPYHWNLAIIAVLIEDALKLSLGGKLTIFTSHQMKQLLNGRGQLWLSDQSIPRYQVVLMENSGMAIYPCKVLYPTTLLPTPKGSLPFHSCLEILDHWTKAQDWLSEVRLTNPEKIWYTDWSSSVLDGKRTGYAVVSNFATIETKPFPPGTSTQLAELIALNSSFRAGKRKKSSHLHWL